MAQPRPYNCFDCPATFLFGAVLYRVTHVEHDNDSNVIARVQYTDGGDGARVWGIDQEVPLVRG